jgi:tetratricopeptide (TPR) repeat protein
VTPKAFVFWVHASSQGRFEEAYKNIADKLELPGRNDVKTDVLQLLSEWLSDEANGIWTMVLDSVDDTDIFFAPLHHKRNEVDAHRPNSLAAYLPQTRNGSFLITSRSKDAAIRLTGGYSNIQEVCPMNAKQSLQLLRNKLQNAPDEESAMQLLFALDHIPLAISQAAAYINRRAHMTTARYLAEFRTNSNSKQQLLNWETSELRRHESASNSVVTTWQLSFERIRQEQPSAADLLSIMSLFNPQNIPEPVLRRYRRAALTFDSSVDVEKSFEDDLDLLQVYSLVATTAQNNMCEMHPLVQFCTRRWISSLGNSEHWESEFVTLMAQEFPIASYGTWPQCQQLLPHVEQMNEREPKSDNTLRLWAQVMTNAASYMRMRGNYTAAQKAATKALARREKLLGCNHEATLMTLHHLALILHAQGKYFNSERLYRRLITAQATVLGQDHPEGLLSLSDLAMVLQDQGHFGECEQLHLQVLTARKRILGQDHLLTSTSESNLASVLRDMGRYSDAENLYRHALEIGLQTLGKHHPDTFRDMNNLGGVLQVQGQYPEAEELYRSALEGKRQTLGPHHPSTLTSTSNVASILIDNEKYSEAETLSRFVLKHREATDPQHQHPHTLTSLHNLGRALEVQAKLEEAEKFYRRALEGREKTLGEHSLDTLISVNNLAILLGQMDRFGEATSLFQRACCGLEVKFGKEHPWTILCRNNFEAMRQRSLRRNDTLYGRMRARFRAKST